MKRVFNKLLIKPLIIIFVFSALVFGAKTVMAAEAPLISTVDELVNALNNAKPGDTILVGDITFQPMPRGMIAIPQNVTIKSGKDTNAVFTNATFALNGTTTGSAPLEVNFENIDFRGDQAGMTIDLNSPQQISSQMPGIMKTMCAAIFKMNVNATYTGCSFEGYHYGYGGVFNAIYSSEDNRYALNLELNGCSFRNNASKFGGSIYLSGYNHNINLDARHCVFNDNAATTGGAIWAEKSNIHLFDCSLIGNSYLNAEVDSPNGGALALYNCGVDLDRCLIANNDSGGEGAGVFCAITPFKTLIMENCTIIGNTSKEDEGLSVVLSSAEFDTQATAHIYFSSLFGEQNFATNVELFGCLLVDKNITPAEPSEDNGYCLCLTPELAKERGLYPETPEHVSIPEEYEIPKEVTDTIANGKFAEDKEAFHVGDNYEIIHSENAENNNSIIWIPILVAAVVAAAGITVAFYLRKKKAANVTDEALKYENEAASSDWIDHVCEKPAIIELLSRRELEVMHKLLEGKSRKQIAEELFVTESTIKKHSANIYSKLDVHNRTELTYKLINQ